MTATTDHPEPGNSDDTKLRFIEAIEQGASIGSIAQHFGISRSTAYSWLKLWRCNGDAWLKGNARTRYVYRSTPFLVWNASVIKSVALNFPDWGCDRIAEHLQDFGVRVSSPTVQEILIELELGKESDRAAELRRQAKANRVDACEAALTQDQTRYIRQRDLKVRPVIPIGSAPGQVLVQDGCWSSSFPRANVIVDTFDNRIFCSLSRGTRAGSAIDAMDEVISLLLREGVEVETVTTDHGHEFCAEGEGVSYPSFLASRGISHVRFGKKGLNPRRPEIIVKAWATVMGEFLSPRLYDTSDALKSIDDLDADMFEWLQNMYKMH